jgi:hypothetical protein
MPSRNEVLAVSGTEEEEVEVEDSTMLAMPT